MDKMLNSRGYMKNRITLLVNSLLVITVLNGFHPTFAQTDGKIDIEGGKLHYRIYGTGTPILLLGGGPGFSGDYLIPVAKELGKTYQCILIDQRGTGESTLVVYDSTTINLKTLTSDHQVLLEHLNLNSWIVLGHSWGGMLAMVYASHYPSSIRALGLLNSGGINLDFSKYFGSNIHARMRDSDRDSLKYWSDSTRKAIDPEKAWIKRFKLKQAAYMYDQNKVSILAEHFTINSFSSDMSNNIWIDLEKNYDFREPLKNFDKPVLLLCGRQDPIGETTAYQIRETLTQAELTFIEECGHYPWIEQPEEFYKLIGSFIENIIE